MGKTALIEILHKEFGDFEVISADAFQVYRGFDLGTAKPDTAFRQRIVHHLIDVCDPNDAFSVSRFFTEARRIGEEIRSRGLVPLVSGGTAFYFRHLIMGLPEAPAADPVIRATLENEYRESGIGPLRDRLVALDPRRAEEVHPHDHYRIIRALEIALSRQSDPRPPAKDSWSLSGSGQAWGFAVLTRTRDELIQRINTRVDLMFSQGLPAEWRALVAAGNGADCPAMKGIGYQEFFEGTDEDHIRDRIIIHTRQYAKRQMTFFRSLPGAVFFPADDHPALFRWYRGLTKPI